MADGLNNFFQSFSGRLGSAIGNPVAQKRPEVAPGLQRTPFLQPIDLLSTVYVVGDSAPQSQGGFKPLDNPLSVVYTTLDSNSAPQSRGGFKPLDPLSVGIIPQGVNRTDGNGPIQLEETKRDGSISLQRPGFTPLNYFKSESGEFKIKTPENFFTTEERSQYLKEAFDSPIGDKRMGSFRFSYDDYVKFNSKLNDLNPTDGSNQKQTKISEFIRDYQSLVNYHDKEDPVYFGFEIIIDVNNSPLLNGQVKEFITKFSNDIPELQGRLEIYEQFKKELRRYFRFNVDINNSVEQQIDDPSIFIKTSDIPRRYYVRSILGISALVESNTPEATKSFIDYPKTKITLSFLEDTSLNLGTLATLYKSLYWSKLRGKSLIPENLLRFDCQIIVSELRNMAQIRKSNDFMEIVKSNLSRYVYSVYECQFFFDKMTHPDSIDMGTPPAQVEKYDVTFNFKYSNMNFERWNPVFESGSGEWISLNDAKEIPLIKNQPSQNDTEINQISFYNSSSFPQSSIDVNSTLNLNEENDSTDFITSEKNKSDLNIYQLSQKDIPQSGSATSQDIYQNRLIIVDPVRLGGSQDIYQNQLIIVDPVRPGGSNDIFGRASEQLLENIKTAGLNEAQRQLNIRFRVLNDSIDNIRNQFGIGRMPPPTNVYFPQQNSGAYGQSNVFFDVQNALRNFGGDVLTGLIGGG
jgi:hypothetical protein